MKIKTLTAILFFLAAAVGPPIFAFEVKEEYPKLANYYLQPNILKKNYEDLAKYDLLILDVDTQTIDPGMFDYLRSANPDIKTLAYIPSQSVNTEDLSAWARFRNITYKEAEKNDLWLRDASGNKIYFNHTWPTIYFIDPSRGWDDFLSDLAKNDVMSRGVWDGIFYDMVFANLCWLNNGDIDLNRDGRKDDIKSINETWQKEMSSLLIKTKNKIGDYPVVINVDLPDYYQKETNGVMMENFPQQWLGAESWSITMDQYLNRLPKNNQAPNIYIINANTGNTGQSDMHQKMRFGLTSALLGTGYFSFNHGDQNHAQTWWYDEYDVNLGQAVSEPYNLLDKNSRLIKKGLWRRDFENGIVLVNSTDVKQTYIFQKEELEKINGYQDRRINDGSKINHINLAPQDGIILLKTRTDIIGSVFTNGGFVRVFDRNGNKLRNGFFSYLDSYPGNSRIIITDLDNDGSLEHIVYYRGEITIYKKTKKIITFVPYKNFFGDISLAVADLNGNGLKEIITGAGPGGGPHVRVFSKDGRPIIGGFFAYDKNFRGGVNVAVMDLDGDGFKEIITGAGPGGGPHVRVFSKDGRPLIGGFFAYDKDSRNGVNIAAGDINNSGEKEIITGPGPGAEPKVAIFTKDGVKLGEFKAFDGPNRHGLKVMVNDINNDKNQDILVSTIDFP